MYNCRLIRLTAKLELFDAKKKKTECANFLFCHLLAIIVHGKCITEVCVYLWLYLLVAIVWGTVVKNMECISASSLDDTTRLSCQRVGCNWAHFCTAEQPCALLRDGQSSALKTKNLHCLCTATICSAFLNYS